MIENNRIGRGIASIFNANKIIENSATNNKVELVDIELITENPFQPRTNFTKKEIRELCDSIKQYGLIQPITVRKNQNKYELISGERRLRASILAGLKTIPVFIKDVENKNMRTIALVENIQRQDLDPIEIALSLKHLISDYQLTHDSVAQKIGKNRSTITNYLRLLKLDPIIQAGIRDQMITMGHAKAILNTENQSDQIEIYYYIIKHQLSVRETEKIGKNYQLNPISKKLTSKGMSNYHQKIEQNLSAFFDEKISLKIKKNGSGKIEIPFESEQKLNEIITLLQSS